MYYNSNIFKLVIITTLLSSGCGLFSKKTVAPAFDSVSINLSRMSFSDTEFENYKVTGDKVFQECGSYRRGKYYPKEQKVLRLRASAITYLREEVEDFIQKYKQQEWKWDAPGKNLSPADPGQLKADIISGKDNITINTSLDGISSPNVEIARYMKSLVRTVRGISGSPPCGNREFYGITSLQND